MRNLLNPKWLLVTTITPVLLLGLLCYGEFAIIRTLLPPASIALWQRFGLALGGLEAVALAYAGWCWRGGRPLGAWYAGAALLAYGSFLGAYTALADQVVPRQVPHWLVPTDILVYVWTFVMPTLAHALLVLVVHATPANRLPRVWPSVGLAAAVPVVAFGLLKTLDWLQGGRWLEYGNTVVWVAALGLVPLVFLFFLVRAVYVISLRRATGWGSYETLWKVVIALIFPLLGLAINTGALFGLGYHSDHGIFGDFDTPWFYGLGLLNGLLLCLPATRATPRWRLALWLGRGALLSYTGYFFLVFLPYLPFSVFAVVLIGVGFLMLTPLVLLVVHVHELSEDFRALLPHFSRRALVAGLVGSVAVLPLALTASYWHSRRVLHAALECAYSPDYAKKYALDAEALVRTLATVRQHKDQNRDFLFGAQQPYLSAYFNWLVLDNLTLSDSKLATLESIFVGNATAVARRPGWERREPAPGAALRQLTARSTYDAQQQAWVSWVDLAVANPTSVAGTTEYSTIVDLPAGCWVGDYYLDINGHREPGILAEKKAADWVYAQIVHQRDYRDPGLLTALGPDKVNLRVYPVQGQAVRRTGFQLLHKEPLTLRIDGQAVQLGSPAAAPPAAPVVAPGGAVVYLSALAQQQLPLVRRRPYYHFLVDVSAGQLRQKQRYKRVISEFLRRNKPSVAPHFTLVNTYATPVPASADWQHALNAFPNAGGCYLTGAMQRLLAAAQVHPAPTYPVVVLVADTLAVRELATDFAAFAAAYPEGDQFWVLPAQGPAERHSLRHASAQALPPVSAPTAPLAVRAWPTAAQPRAYLPDAGRPVVVLSRPDVALPPLVPATSRWLTGLLLRGYDQWATLHPAAAAEHRPPFVQASLRARLLTPLTSYLALENEAQKAALRRKQTQTLAANANLDAQESPTDSATEVPLDDYWPLLLLLGLGMGWAKLRQQ